jgi:hypothetical protein
MRWRGILTNALPRKISAGDELGKDATSEGPAPRRIEITVEQEVLTFFRSAGAKSDWTGQTGEIQHCSRCGQAIATTLPECSAHVVETLPEQYTANPAQPLTMLNPKDEVK